MMTYTGDTQEEFTKFVEDYRKAIYNSKTIKVKKVNPNAIIPTRGSAEAAGIDLYACIDEPLTIRPGDTVMFGSGIACEFPDGYFGAVVPRSSVGIKKKLALPNCVGVIDHDYNGEIKIAFTNIGKETQTIEPGDRVAQMVLLPYVTFDIAEVDTLTETERGEGGIGSTGR